MKRQKMERDSPAFVAMVSERSSGWELVGLMTRAKLVRW